jgi:hypothetical protein
MTLAYTFILYTFSLCSLALLSFFPSHLSSFYYLLSITLILIIFKLLVYLISILVSFISNHIGVIIDVSNYYYYFSTFKYLVCFYLLFLLLLSAFSLLSANRDHDLRIRLLNKKNSMQSLSEKQFIYKGKLIKIISDLSVIALKAWKSCNCIFQVMRVNNCHWHLLYQAKLFFKSSGEIKTFQEKY